MTKKTAPIAFEKSLAELEALVEKLEQGDVPLEDALKNFERGVQLTRECQSALKAAQRKVEILLKKNNSEARLAPFDTELDDDGAIDEDDDEDAR